MWKSLCSRGNLLLQNIVVSFSRGYYSIVLLPKQTSCQTSQADADRFCACTAACCQDLDPGVLVSNQTSRVKTLTGWRPCPVACGPRPLEEHRARAAHSLDTPRTGEKRPRSMCANI